MKPYVIYMLVILFALSGKHVMAEQITLGTATKGGGFELFGRTVSEVVNSSNSKIKIKTVPSKGSRENLKLLLAGEVDAALVEGNAAHAAFQTENAKNKLAVLWVMYPSPGAFIVRADTPHKTITDLKGKTIAWGTSASGLRLLAKSVIEGMGLNTDKDFTPVILKRAADGPPMIFNKKVDALWGGGIGWPTFKKISNAPEGARFIYPSETEITIILKSQPHLLKMSIPANTYKGQTEAINSVGLWSLILVRKDVSENKVYTLSETLASLEKKLAERLPQTAFTTSGNTAENVKKEKLHPGVLKYLQEKKLLK